ncbi:MAG: ACP S-malonyltransferase [Legionellaceae bacterium]|nr:ACP S-malonyltransferase [Legionellaceae bacterium]
MSTYLFPGQGSQAKGMGNHLFKIFPEKVAAADNSLGYSIAELCEDLERLNQTQYTQPALYVVNALSYYQKIAETNKKPDYLAGHSLGEYNALLAAEVFNFETGLILVKKRAELMSQVSGGAMAAVIGLTAEAVQTILEQENLKEVNIANYNSYAQVVISGARNLVVCTQAIFEKAGASLFIPLKVSGAFHSPLMETAQQAFKEFLTGFNFTPPSIQVITNVTAKPYQSDHIHALLAQQITSPVRWTSSIEYLLQQGETEFLEVGPGTVLTGLLRRIKNAQ